LAVSNFADVITETFERAVAHRFSKIARCQSPPVVVRVACRFLAPSMICRIVRLA
jgi:hypothetical protein